MSLNDSPVLEEVLLLASEEIAEIETENLAEYDDEYVLECLGRVPVDPDEINDLVAARDPRTMEYFELNDLSEEDLEEWDANELDEWDLPQVCDFDPDFEPTNPFAEGYSLTVEFAEAPEEDYADEDEVTESLTELFNRASGDYSEVKEYIARIYAEFYNGDKAFEELVKAVTAKLGITNFEYDYE